MNQDFNKVLIFSLVADHFIISNLMNYWSDGNIKCNASVADVYQSLLGVFKIEYTTWKEPFSGRINICSPSENSKDIEEFLENIEDRMIFINHGARKQFDIPMPMIYKDGKDLDNEICDKYLSDIEEFIQNAPRLEIRIPISNNANHVEYQTIWIK
jgi:hypothetical protein